MTTTSHQEDLLDEALEETFPASDVPRAYHDWSEPSVAKPGNKKIWKKLLVATDFSERCREMLKQSMDIARAVDASIDLVHVRERFGDLVREGSTRTAYELEAARDSIDRALAETAQRIIDAGISCQTTSLEGSPAHQIVAHAAKTEADVIVLGSRGHGSVLHVLVGSIARRVARTAACVVLVIPVPDDAPSSGHHEGRSA
jgi:nucleotide-binding universal stress UspA family protein